MIDRGTLKYCSTDVYEYIEILAKNNIQIYVIKRFRKYLCPVRLAVSLYQCIFFMLFFRLPTNG